MLKDLGFDFESEVAAGNSIRQVSLFRGLSGLTAAVTLAVVPWFLGGAIPQAKLALQLGAILSSIFAIVAR